MKVTLALLTAIILWSSAFVGIRYGLTAYHPGSLGFLRYLIASITLIVFFIHDKSEVKLKRSDIPSVFLLGLIGMGIYNIALNYGELSVSASVASFIISQAPVISAILAMFFLKEKMSAQIWIGIFISLIGVTVIAFGQRHNFNFQYGIAFVVIAVFCSGIYTVLQKPLLRKASPIKFVCFAIWSGTLSMSVFLPQTIHDIQHASITQTLDVIYLGIFPGAIGFLLWSYGLKHYPAVKVSSFLYLSPFFAAFLSWLFLNEAPTVLTLSGGAIALIGAYIVNKRRSVKSIPSNSLIKE